jgi:hypothetical protein
MTLEHIIHVHSKNLQVLLLDETNFNLPNLVRPFFDNVAEAHLDLFDIRSFLVHERAFLRCVDIGAQLHDDEILKWSNERDDPYRSWVEVESREGSSDCWHEVNTTGMENGKEYMRIFLSGLVEQLVITGFKQLRMHH